MIRCGHPAAFSIQRVCSGDYSLGFYSFNRPRRRYFAINQSYQIIFKRQLVDNQNAFVCHGQLCKSPVRFVIDIDYGGGRKRQPLVEFTSGQQAVFLGFHRDRKRHGERRTDLIGHKNRLTSHRHFGG